MNFPEPFYRWRPHPWHGLEVGPDAPHIVTAYIEMTPFDSVKYELDKSTGYIRVDRPHRSSAQPPALYGFIPRTYCGARTAALSKDLAKRGDRDPLDICVVSERPITKTDIIMSAKVVGGLQMIDNDEADDKIIAVFEKDLFWGKADDISELPPTLVERLRHYFSTYKMVPGREAPNVHISEAYGRERAEEVIAAAMADYQSEYGSGPNSR